MDNDGGDNPVDVLLQSFNYLKQAILSQRTLQLLNHYLLSPSSPFHDLKRQLLAIMAPIIEPLVTRLNSVLTNSPDAVLLILMVIVVVLVLQLLAWVQRMVVWITGLVFRVLFWTSVAAGVAFVWQRGLEQTVKDGIVLMNKIAGYGAALVNVWISAYREYDAQQNGARAVHTHTGR